MASNIEWCDSTWNPTTGCTKNSPECKFCYAEKETNKKKLNPKTPKYWAGFDKFVEHEGELKKPIGTKKPTTFFVNSMSDLFHEDATLEFIQKVFGVMNKTPQHTYQVLTKRHELLTEYASQLTWSDNIWMGVSVGTNKSKVRIQHLADCPAKHKFLSIEPLIGSLEDLELTGIDLVYVGGESGSGDIRPMKPEWVDGIIDTCKKQGVKFFFKQWGHKKNNPDQNDPTISKKHPLHSKGGCLINGKIVRENPCIKDFKVKYMNLFGDEYLVVEELNDLKVIWELQSCLPLLEKDVYNELKKDIRINGLLDPILYIETPDKEKLVIEGHTRLNVCMDLNIKDFPIKQVKEKFNSLDEIKLWMVKHQAQRRNLTSVQKLKLAFFSKPIIQKLAAENQKLGGKKKSSFSFINNKIDTNEVLSKIAGVGRTTTVMYSKLVDSASVSLIKKLDKGEVSIKNAYSMVEKKPVNKNGIKVDVSKSATVSKKENIKINISSPDEGIKKLQNKQIDVVVSDEKLLPHIKANKKLRIGILNVENKTASVTGDKS